MSSLRIALIHNLARGGARRAMQEHEARLTGEVREFCLGTAVPVTASPHVIPLRRRAERISPLLRPLPRHLDLAALVVAWRAIARAVNRAGCDVVLAHPCQFLQAPPALSWINGPSVYFCHEPRRVDYETAASARVNPRTRLMYAGLHRMERHLDRLGVGAADCLLTNSRYTARGIESAYGREAVPIPLGVPELFREAASEEPRTHLLSVGSLIESKGHDFAIRATGRANRRWPLIVVAPSPQSRESARLEEIARESSVALEIRTAVTDRELRDLYRGAVATLYLAREEPLGLASLEAQACGSPVVVANEGGLPETMIAGNTGWAVWREDASAVARAIDGLEDREVARTVSTLAREHGVAQSWERSATYVQAALERVAGG